MKTTNMSIRAIVLSAFFTASAIAAPGSHAFAQAPSLEQVSAEKPAITVNFLGAVGDKLYFEVSLHQPENTKSMLRIRDENGVVLYSEWVTRISQTRKIQVSKNEINKLDFVMSTGKEEFRKTFEIKVDYRETLEIKDVTSL